MTLPALQPRPEATLEEAEAIFDEALLCHDHFAPFVKHVFHETSQGVTYLHNWHIDLMAEYLEAVERGELHRVIFNVPPGSLKSTVLSVAYSAWRMGRNPALRIMGMSYAQELATRDNVKCRDVMKSAMYRQIFPDIEFKPDQNEKKRFELVTGGHRIAVSPKGLATGDGGELLMFDDPMNPRQAHSEPERKTINKFISQTFINRLRDKKNGAILGAMQRLHGDDPTGALLANGSKDSWTVVKIPAIAEKTTLFSFGNFRKVFKEGEVLHPAYEPREVLDQLKTDMGSTDFNAQYQQTPGSVDGNIIERSWLRYYGPKELVKKPTQFDQECQSWDLALKKKKDTDFVVGLVLYRKGPNYFLIERVRARWGFNDTLREFRKLTERFPTFAKYVEDAANGPAVMETLRSEISGIKDVQPYGSKEARLRAVAPLFEAGNVFFPREATWLGELEEELLAFPNWTNDDQVDALSQGLNEMKIMATKGANKRVRTL